MKTTWKILLGVASLVPLVFFASFFFWLVPAFFARRVEGEPTLFSQRFDTLQPLAIGVSGMLLFLLVVYATLLYRRPDVSSDEKIGVLVTIFVTNGIVLPFAWWLYVWRESSLAHLSRRRRAPIIR